jgi:hypothetical protein
MKSFISGALIASAIVACLSLNIQAKPINPVHYIAVSDTGKMSKDKMKMDKMDKKKTDKKMKMDKMKIKKDTMGKM